ncbi:DUF5334 family protein [Halodesulfovibrio sp.]|uniref:DUF5334 family protein n=1 Tax=Halodesulfovibrio sp. TaxID=1912772 RepID=UPI0025F6380B|nr:DUF5334 family protein [Halodesulfovibrio sp.]MCT4625680.1 DUF5334 domain-containing protein [Halodesulfovibrio sp.]
MACTFPALAWDGYDYDTGSSVEIESGNLVRTGEQIDFYDYNTGEYHSTDVMDVYDSGSTVDVEVYDYDTGEVRTLEMDNY